jgi:hypothetical protein
VGLLEACELKHATYFPQIRQVFVKIDHEFLQRRGSRKLVRRVRRERHRIGVAYLKSLRADFQSLLRMAKLVTALSPAVAAVHERERSRLTLTFFWRYEIIRLALLAGFSPLPQLSGLANVVSGLSVQMERAIKELGERAAMASELASALDRRGVHLT